MVRWIFLLLLATTSTWAQVPPTADEIIHKLVARDKQLVERRKAFGLRHRHHPR